MAEIIVRRTLYLLRDDELMMQLDREFPWVGQLMFCLLRKVKRTMGWLVVVRSITWVNLSDCC